MPAAALRCLGGHFQGRLLFRNDKEKARAKATGITDLDRKYALHDLVRGDVLFAATGVTAGSLLDGVRRTGGMVETDTILLDSYTGTTRRIRTQHRA